MAISASATAPAGDTPARFPNTRAAKQAPLQKAREHSGEEGASSSALQARSRRLRRTTQRLPACRARLPAAACCILCASVALSLTHVWLCASCARSSL
jgi:hypothetical protein